MGNKEKETNSQPGRSSTRGLAALVAGALIGCVTPDPPPQYFARSIDKAEPRDHFGYGEAIALHVERNSGKTINYFIQSMSTGKIVNRAVFHIPQDWASTRLTIGQLPTGSYFTWLEVEGNTVAEWKFSVR